MKDLFLFIYLFILHFLTFQCELNLFFHMETCQSSLVAIQTLIGFQK